MAVHRSDDGTWSWSIDLPDGTHRGEEGLRSYDLAEEAADEEMRLQLKTIAQIESKLRTAGARGALSGLSPAAQRVMRGESRDADTATLNELTSAMAMGRFDFATLPGSSVLSRSELEAFVAQRRLPPRP